MLNDARVASLGLFKDNICTTRINKEKKSLKSSSGPPKIRPNSAGLVSITITPLMLKIFDRTISLKYFYRANGACFTISGSPTINILLFPRLGKNER